MIFIVTLRAADSCSLMKIRPKIVQPIRQSNRKKAVSPFSRRAAKIYIISKKLLREPGELIWWNFDCIEFERVFCANEFKKNYIFYLLKISYIFRYAMTISFTCNRDFAIADPAEQKQDE